MCKLVYSVICIPVHTQVAYAVGVYVCVQISGMLDLSACVVSLTASLSTSVHNS